MLYEVITLVVPAQDHRLGQIGQHWLKNLGQRQFAVRRRRRKQKNHTLVSHRQTQAMAISLIERQWFQPLAIGNQFDLVV